MFAYVGAIAIGTSVYPSMPLDPAEDLAAIAVAVTSPLVWLVNPASPFRSLPDMFARGAQKGRFVQKAVQFAARCPYCCDPVIGHPAETPERLGMSAPARS